MANAVVRATVVDRGPHQVNGSKWVLYRVFDAEPLNGAAAVVDSLAPVGLPGTTPLGFMLGDGGYYGLWVKAAGTTPRYDVRLLQSYDDTEGNYVIPELNGTPLDDIADALGHVTKMEPMAMTRLRLRLVGNASNGSDTTVTAYLMVHP